MNKMNKQKLYESIMRNVGRQVRKTINEMEKPGADAIAASGLKIDKNIEGKRFEKYLHAAVDSFNSKYGCDDKDLTIRAYVFYTDYDDIRLEISYNGREIYSPYLGCTCKNGSKWRIYRKDECPYRPDYICVSRAEALSHIVKDMPRLLMERIRIAVQHFEKLQKEYVEYKERIENGDVERDQSLDWINENRKHRHTNKHTRCINEGFADMVKISITSGFIEFSFLAEKETYLIDRYENKNDRFIEYKCDDRRNGDMQRYDSESFDMPTTLFSQFNRDAARNVVSLLKILFGDDIDYTSYLKKATDYGYSSEEIIWPNMMNFDSFDDETDELIRSYQQNVYNIYAQCNEGIGRKLKNLAVGTAIATSVLGGMQSCSNINPAKDPTEQTSIYKHDEYPDYSDRPWAFESYIGRKMEATYLVIEDGYRIRKLCVNLPSNADEYEAQGFEYYASWQDCDWAIFYKKTEKRDKYFVDTYHSQGAPLFDEPYKGTYYDGEAYFEVWYSDDDSKSMEERVEFIRIYRSEDEKKETTWTVTIDNIKGTNRLDINNDGPNHGKK